MKAYTLESGDLWVCLGCGTGLQHWNSFEVGQAEVVCTACGIRQAIPVVLQKRTSEKKGYELHSEWRQKIAQQLKAMVENGEATIGEALVEAMQIEAYGCLAGTKIGELDLQTWRANKADYPSNYTLDDASLNTAAPRTSRTKPR